MSLVLVQNKNEKVVADTRSLNRQQYPKNLLNLVSSKIEKVITGISSLLSSVYKTLVLDGGFQMHEAVKIH